MAEFIAESPRLLRLDLRENEIKTGGLMALALALKVNQSLLRLDLDRDPKKEAVRGGGGRTKGRGREGGGMSSKMEDVGGWVSPNFSSHSPISLPKFPHFPSPIPPPTPLNVPFPPIPSHPIPPPKSSPLPPFCSLLPSRR